MFSICLNQRFGETLRHVTDKLPVPDIENPEECGVYRFETDGSLTNMNAEIIDGYYVFTTDHFSLYAICEVEDEPAENIFVFKIDDANIYCVNDDIMLSVGATATFADDGKVLVPVRALSVAVGVTDLKYDAATGKIAFTDFNGYSVEMSIGSNTVNITDGLTPVASFAITAPVVLNGSAMLPLRDVSALVGGSVKYDNSGYIVASAGAINDADVAGYIASYEAK